MIAINLFSIYLLLNPVFRKVSVSIVADANPVCECTLVTFTATPVNEGSSPSYQWYNGITAVGDDSPVYSYIPADGDAISVVLTSSETCQSGGPATSNTVIMTVNSILPVSVSIVTDANPVNTGTLVTFTATPVNGGTTPAFIWEVNGSEIPGATNSTYSYIPVNNDFIVCIMTSDLSCISGSPATSNTITMVVNSIPDNLLVQSDTITSGQDTCYNALQTITVAGGSAVYLVQNNGTATFIAGFKIRLLPGVTVEYGGHLVGQIAPDGPFCGGVYPLAPAVVTGEQEPLVQLEQDFFTIYPNPTSGNFTLVQKGSKQYGNVKVEVYGMCGERVFKAEMIGEKQHEFNTADIPTGLYFVKIIADSYTEIIKLVKTR